MSPTTSPPPQQQLLLGDDDQAALEAALAFLDSCSDDGSELDAFAELTSATTSSEEPSSPFEHQDEHAQEIFLVGVQHSDVIDTDALRSSAVASPVTQRVRSVRRRAPQPRNASSGATPKPPRKRAVTEILQLREQILQLTARLGVLQKRRLLADSAASSVSVSVRGSALEIGDAVSELRRLEEAEALNAKLKVAGRKQLKLIDALGRVFRKQSSLAADFALLGIPQAYEPPVAAVRHVPTIFEEESLLLTQLDEYLGMMHSRTGAVVAAISAGGSSGVFTRCREVGQGLEFVTNTPLTCGVTDLADFMTTHMSGEGAAKSKGYALSYMNQRSSTSGAFEHRFANQFECQSGKLHIKGISSIRKFDEPNRIALVFSSILNLDGTDLRFQESAWLIMSKAPVSADASGGDSVPPRTLLQSSYVMQPLTSPSKAASCDDDSTVYLRDFVVQAQSGKLRTMLLRVQSGLLELFGTSNRGYDTEALERAVQFGPCGVSTEPE